ncbi:MAG: cation diffusion facilitator family transporter [Acidimicrobiales bacterium]
MSSPPRSATDQSAVRRGLLAAAGANTVLLAVQVVGAIAFGSLALLADSVHQASDVVSLFLAVGVASAVARPSSARYTFGYRRADALGGLLHAALLFGGVVLVVVEAIRRFDGEHHVEGLGVVLLAAVGLVVNAVSARWLHAGQAHGHGQADGHDHGPDHDHGPGQDLPGNPAPRRSLNVDGAVLHLLADALGSAVVLVGGLIILVTGADWVDPVASLLVAAVIVWSAVKLTKASLRVLLDGVPSGVDVAALREVLLADPLVRDAHHLHVRALDGEMVSLTAHVQVDTHELHEAQVVTRRLTTALAERGIEHVTLQAECHPCDAPEC